MAEIRLGTAGWSYDDWVGTFYPPGLPKGQYLEHYAHYFPTVEVDSTFYAIPAESTVMKWVEATPDDFEFCPKLWQGITHDKQLRDARDDLRRYVDVLGLMGPKLGAIVIQLPPFLKPDPESRRAVSTFLDQVSPEYRWAIEFRDPGWVNDDLFDLLRAHNVAWVVQDFSSMPKVPEVTVDFAYFRWLGRRADISRLDEVQLEHQQELDTWVEVIQQMDPKVGHIYGFFNDLYQGHAPASARTMQQRLGLPSLSPSLF